MTITEPRLNKTIIFKLGKEEFGVSVLQTQSIEKLQEITALPQVDSFVRGVMNLRGQIIPVIDLKERLELGKTDVKDSTRILIIKMDELFVGVLVDSCQEVLDISSESIHSADEIKSFVQQEYIRGVARFDDRLVMLLDIECLFLKAELKELEEAIQ